MQGAEEPDSPEQAELDLYPRTRGMGYESHGPARFYVD